jgi:hypothetical protein
VGDHESGIWRTDSRGATNITIDGRRESLTLNGSIRLNANNCALRDTRLEGINVGLNETSSPRRFGITIAVSNVYRTATSGAETTFHADYNIRNGLTEPAGSYELLVIFDFNNLVPGNGAYLPNYTASPPMIVTVTR